ncbi:MAG: hypothetical protein ACYC5F_09780 [Thermoleophilia bacterium]
MAKKFIDFDAMWSEKKSDPVVVHMFGQDWDLPASLGAGVMVQAVRMMAEAGPEADIDEAQAVAVMMQIVPDDILDAWVEKGLTAEQYTDIIPNLLVLYTGQQLEPEGETPAPEDGALSQA